MCNQLAVQYKDGFLVIEVRFLGYFNETSSGVIMETPWHFYAGKVSG